MEIPMDPERLEVFKDAFTKAYEAAVHKTCPMGICKAHVALDINVTPLKEFEVTPNVVCRGLMGQCSLGVVDLKFLENKTLRQVAEGFES